MNNTSVLPRPQAWLSLKKDQISYTSLRKFTAITKNSHKDIARKKHLRCSSKLKVHLPFLLPLQASTTALQIAWYQNIVTMFTNMMTKTTLTEPGYSPQLREFCTPLVGFPRPVE